MRVPLVELVERVYRQIDAGWSDLVARVEEQAAAEGVEPARPACRVGCAACCTYVVAVTSPEAEVIAEWVEARPAGERRALIERIAAWVAEYQRWEAGQPRPTSVAEHRAMLSRWQVGRRACPFLEVETHRCRVYALRPVACRTHHAATIPPQARGKISPDTGQRAREPGDGCFTTAADAAAGHPSTIWTLDGDYPDRAAVFAAEAWSRLGLRWSIGELPMLVWSAGALAYGWRAPRRVEPVPVLRRALPVGRGRGLG